MEFCYMASNNASKPIQVFEKVAENCIVEELPVGIYSS